MKATTGNPRQYTALDNACRSVDQLLRAMFSAPRAHRPNPAAAVAAPALSATEQRVAAAVMRVNHAGEIAAQALYHGQAVFSRNADLQSKLRAAAAEESDHLVWCAERVVELASHTSYLRPFWYGGSFVIGLTAGLMGDQWSLGFVAETEQQVVTHIDRQLTELPANDGKSAAILQQMQLDEAQHQQDAILAGAASLPTWVRRLMRMAAQVMVKTAYWI